MQRRDFIGKGMAAGAAALAALPLTGMALPKGTFVHCVYFWMKDDLTAEQLAAFEKGLAGLAGLGMVRHGFYGTPAATDRPIIDRSYAYALVVVFDDAAAHDAYQEAAFHETFRQESSSLWKEVKIYDFLAA